MSNTSGTKSNGSRMEVPQAKSAMDKFKMEVASEAGSIGGEMVRQMIQRQEQQMSGQN